MPQVIGILDKEFGRRRSLRVALNGGFRARQEVSFTDAGDNGSPPTNQTITVGAELPVGFAVAYAVSAQKIDLVGEVLGAIPLDAENYLPLEAILGVKVYLARNSFLSLGVGRGPGGGLRGGPGAQAAGGRAGAGQRDPQDRVSVAMLRDEEAVGSNPATPTTVEGPVPGGSGPSASSGGADAWSGRRGRADDGSRHLDHPPPSAASADVSGC
ncbi:MAG: hypothetical protein HC863_01850, partial [Myxococcales bacterium]|nr:hypothetical protein [Myxococcales bacterium]